VIPERFEKIIAGYPSLRIAVIGDFTLDRYLEIDPARAETSVETGLPVHNVVNVRTLPGSAGTILNNLAALGAGKIYAVGFCGMDGEGFELRRALASKHGVSLEHFLQSQERRTFTYCKPLIVKTGEVPRELNRLDTKNWSPTPPAVEDELIQSVSALAPNVDAIILLDQVEVTETGVVTRRLLDSVGEVATRQPKLLISADSRRGLRNFPPVIFKMNAVELSALTGAASDGDDVAIKETALTLARANGRLVFVTLAERGMVGASPDGTVEHVPALPVRGEIDIVGAGDAVTANLIAALAAGATVREALELASAAASIVIHQLGTTGEASVKQLRDVLLKSKSA